VKPLPEQADARAIVDRLLLEAAGLRASDLHVDPDAAGYQVRRRIDGLLKPAERFDTAAGRSVVARMMVLAGLLTYRMDIPQEGRIPAGATAAGVEMRLAVMPTTHGLRAAVRLPAELTQPRKLETLGLPESVVEALRKFAVSDGGLLLLTGPAGSGKTTTIYALLEHLRDTQPGLSIIALEDPVERDLPGVTQIEVTPHGQLTYERALRSILRQDPQVLMLGEIRDAATASVAIGAALSGHRLIATLHAGSPAAAIARLLEMGIEPYQVTSALYGVVAQRLLRRAAGAGYAGRLPVAEIALMDETLRRAALDRSDSSALRAIIEKPGYQTLRAAAERAAGAGLTDRAEIERVLGGG
jgi:general secretion pathway protein E